VVVVEGGGSTTVVVVDVDVVGGRVVAVNCSGIAPGSIGRLDDVVGTPHPTTSNKDSARRIDGR
jgi:hypothetical protein